MLRKDPKTPKGINPWQENPLSGFNLMELSIVIAVVALLVFGVTVGIAMKQNAILKSIIDDMGAISTAVHHFEQQYNGLPGDLWNAEEKFGAANTDNGNGDGDINDGTEYLLFWQHLALAGLIRGSYDGATNEPQVGVMDGPYPRSGYYAVSNADNRIVIGLAAYFDTDGDNTIERLDSEDRIAVMTPIDAKKLDEKYDDGLPEDTDGFLLGFVGESPSGACIDTAEYDATNDGIACRIEMLLGRKF